MRLGESAGLYDLPEEALTAGSPNATAKTTCVVVEEQPEIGI